MVFLRMVACGDGKGFFAVHVHFASPKERQNVHELQRRFRQRQSLCLKVIIALIVSQVT